MMAGAVKCDVAHGERGKDGRVMKTSGSLRAGVRHVAFREGTEEMSRMSHINTFLWITMQLESLLVLTALFAWYRFEFKIVFNRNGAQVGLQHWEFRSNRKQLQPIASAIDTTVYLLFKL